MNVVIVGASAGLGRSLSEEAARRGHNIFLVSSDNRDLTVMAASLRLKYGVTANYSACQLGNSSSVAEVVSSIATKAFGPIDALLYPLGLAQQNDFGFLDERTTLELVRANFLSQLHVTAALWPTLLKRPGASVVGFGSVASVRGRRNNVVYAAAKRALSSYFESLRHLASETNIRIHFYYVGYLNTQQTFGKALLLPKSSTERLACLVFDRLGRTDGPLFYPWYWRPISLLVRLVPWFIYKRLEF